MPRTIIDLSGQGWRFGAVERQQFAAMPRDDRSRVETWHRATVPGDTRADLIASGFLPEFASPGSLRQSEWVDERDWWYTIPMAAAEPGLTTVLEADGIDYLSSIWVDDRCLGSHEGMFARQTVVLSPHMRGAGRHELGIRIWGSGALPKARQGFARRVVRRALASAGLGAEYFPDRLQVTKAQFGFGWDFAPRVLTSGIWDDIRLVLARGAYLEDVFAAHEPADDQHDPVAVRWRISLRVRRFAPDGTAGALRAEVVLRELDAGEPLASGGPFPLTLAEEQVIVFDAPPLRRWWPWDQGEPHRYRLTVRLLDERGFCDEKELVTGVRTVARERLSTGHPWRFTVNGRHVFLRGANWVPADILPGTIKPDDYARLVGMAVDAGVNYLRVWGGGLREKAAFWEECDRRGVLVSQEFPLACAFLDHYPRDERYLRLLEHETTGAARLLRNYPSLLAWCGGNEINPRRERLPLRTIERALQREDPTRPWIPASPSEGDVHNWDVWHGYAPWQDLPLRTPPFMSEFGLQALPEDLGTGSDMPEHIRHPAWAECKLQADKLGHYLGAWQETEWPRVVRMSQRVQAAALQTGIEACRLRRDGSGHAAPCGGVAFWQFNEPWRAVTWSVVDRLGRPKAAYEMLKGSYAPFAVVARFARRVYLPGDLFRFEVWLVNDEPVPRAVTRVTVLLDGQPVWERAGCEVAAASAGRIGAADARLAEPPRELVLVCEAGGEEIARNRYDLAVHLPPPQPALARLVRRVKDWLLEIG